MAIIGWDSDATGGGVGQTKTEPHRLTRQSGYTYTAASGQEVFKVGFRCGAYGGDGSGIEIGVYDITGGLSGATKVTSTTITSISTGAWNTTTFAGVALTGGNVYAVAWRILSATNLSMWRVYVGPGGTTSYSTLDGNSALNASWTDSSDNYERYAVYAETRSTTTSTPYITLLPQLAYRRSNR